MLLRDGGAQRGNGFGEAGLPQRYDVHLAFHEDQPVLVRVLGEVE